MTSSIRSARRSAIAVGLTTIRDAGVAGFEASFGQLWLAPKGTPPPAAVVTTLNEALGSDLIQPGTRTKR